jgi:hypothetical protein
VTLSAALDIADALDQLGTAGRVLVVLHQFDDGAGALDDQRAVAIEQREEPRLPRHQGG